MAALLAGKRSAVDFWRDSTYYRIFPEEYLPFLRTVVAPSMFHPMATMQKSPACAHLCAWARRVTAGLYAAKTASLRIGANPSPILNEGDIHLGGGGAYPSPAFGADGGVYSRADDGSMSRDMLGDMSSLQGGGGSTVGSVFLPANISAQSPRRRVEQFVSYPGTYTAGGFMLTSSERSDEGHRDAHPKKRALSIVAAVPVSFAEESLLDEHACVFNAAMLVARPLDRVDVCLLVPANPNPNPNRAGLGSQGGLPQDEGKGQGHGQGEGQGDDSEGPYDAYTTQMMLIFARGYYESRLVALSHSPLHRIVVPDGSGAGGAGAAHVQQGDTSAVSVSFRDSKGWSELSAPPRGKTYGHGAAAGSNMDALAHALSETVAADLLVVGVGGLPLSASAAGRADKIAASRSCPSVALVFGRHWALASKAENSTWPISRFVVFVSGSAASRAAFSVREFPFSPPARLPSG